MQSACYMYTNFILDLKFNLFNYQWFKDLKLKRQGFFSRPPLSTEICVCKLIETRLYLDEIPSVRCV